MRHFTAILIGSILMLATTVQPARSSTIWGTSSGLDLSSTITGSYSISGSDYTDTSLQKLVLSWTVTQGANGIWAYQYSWTGNTKDISHFILEVTEGDFDIQDGSYNAIVGPTTYTPTSNGNSNPGSFEGFYGIKFDELSEGTATVTSVTLFTTHAPVWGNFYIKAATSGAWNSALDVEDYENNALLTTSAFIVRPDGAVPIPGSVLLLGSGCVAIAGLRARKLSKHL